MAKIACVIMGLAFLGLGILGVTGFMPMFRNDPIYINIGEIVLGGFGLLVGIYARQSGKNNQQIRQLSKQTREGEDRQKLELDQLREEKEQSRQDNMNRQQQENEQLRKLNEQQRQENEQMRKNNDQQIQG